MPNNTPDENGQTVVEAIRSMPEEKEPSEITTPDYPFAPAFIGASVAYGIWCATLVEHIEKIAGRSPRIAQEVKHGKRTGKILVVDDNYTTQPISSHTDGVIIQRFHKTRSQWETTS